MGEFSTGSISMMGCFFGCFRFKTFHLIDDDVVCRNPPPSFDEVCSFPPEQIMSRNQHLKTSPVSSSSSSSNDRNSGEDDINKVCTIKFGGLTKAGIPSETLEAKPEKDSSSIKPPRCVEAYVKNNNVAQAFDNIFTPKKICYEKEPFPTPLRLTDEMQTPATVYPTSQDTAKNGSRIHSQYIYPVGDGDFGNSEKESDHQRNPGDDEDSDVDNNAMLTISKIQNGIPNSTSKYKEDQKVCWHATPFVERLEKELVRNHKPNATIQQHL